MPENTPATPAASPENTPASLVTGMPPGKMWGYVKDLLVILVIPGFLWVVKLEVNNARQDLLIEQQKAEIARLEVRINDNADIDDKVQQNALKLVQLEGKIDTANGRLDEIKALLR